MHSNVLMQHVNGLRNFQFVGSLDFRINDNVRLFYKVPNNWSPNRCYKNKCVGDFIFCYVLIIVLNKACWWDKIMKI